MLHEYLVMCWRVWGIRNSFYQTGTAPDFSSVPNWRTEYIDRLKSANQLQYTGFGHCLLAAKWKKPPHGFFKLNVDARRGSCSNKMGFGAVLRDANGKIVEQAGQADTLLMEANVVLLGIKWLLEMQVRDIEIESDSLVVIRYLTGNDHLVSSLGHLIDDIKSLTASFRVIFFKHVLSTGNQLAYRLAKLATTGSGSCSTWLQHPPPCISHWLSIDNND
ncbi:Polynucleotidyl transferase, ribonuclease H-like superfamily protein [Gossypium australe]|uniref:Polynucleotidyl transferase, ribonuclease H-like superfamily protein n=1 Tax=Gossypium australe TaxID=47621 RepID=A0A5B6US60_9ROSI|nr:Polynucleotidyl transferase, ribonuclease H-like superfamily protein [Gossypium australe]